MSSVLVIQSFDTIYMGSDTAVSAKIDNTIYRLSEDGKKLFEIDNFLIFCSGNLRLSYKIIDLFKASDTKTIHTLREIANKEYQSTFSQEQFNLDILVATYNDGKAILYQISPYNDFEIKVITVNGNELGLWTGGIKTNEAYELAYKEIANRTGVIDCYKRVFDTISYEEIGGKLNLYKISHSGIQNILNYKIKEGDLKRIEEYNISFAHLIIAERLMGKVILGNLLHIGDNDGIVTLQGDLITIKDNTGKTRVLLGQYQTSKYGLKLLNKAGNSVVLDEDGILQSYGLHEADNVDSTHPLKLRFYIPDETITIRKVLINFSRENFRAYSTAASSGGATTTTSGIAGYITSTSTGFVDGIGGFVSGSSRYTGSGGGHSHGASSDSSGSHNHGGSASSHNHGNPQNLNTAPGITTDGSHSHSISVSSTGDHDHSYSLMEHTHSLSWPHRHDIDLPNHTHGIMYGIYEGTLPTNISVKVNGNTTHTGINTDQANLNVASNCVKGWNTIELSSSQLGRINASLFIQLFLST